MKKTLLALAVLGTAGIAHAQTAVVIDGSIDNSVINREFKNSAGVSTNRTIMERNQRNTNYIGISGTEDLGRGLKAIFQIRTGYGSDDHLNNTATGAGGTAGAAAIGDQNVWLGLQGGFGTVKLGRDLTPAFLQTSAYSVFGTGFLRNFGSMNVGTASARWSNSISYTTPKMGGFGLQIMTASRHEVSGAATAAIATPEGTPISARLSYGAGPLSAGLAITRNGGNNGTTSDSTLWNLGGSYDFGVAKIKAQYERDNNTRTASTTNRSSNGTLLGATDIGNAWLVGAEGGIPGTAVVLKAQYAKRNTATMFTPFEKAYGIGADYNMSKRTVAYLYLGKTETVGTAATAGSNRDAVIGVRHAF